MEEVSSVSFFQSLQEFVISEINTKYTSKLIFRGACNFSKITKDNNGQDASCNLITTLVQSKPSSIHIPRTRVQLKRSLYQQSLCKTISCTYQFKLFYSLFAHTKNLHRKFKKKAAAKSIIFGHNHNTPLWNPVWTALSFPTRDFWVKYEVFKRSAWTPNYKHKKGIWTQIIIFL